MTKVTRLCNSNASPVQVNIAQIVYDLVYRIFYSSMGIASH